MENHKFLFYFKHKQELSLEPIMLDHHFLSYFCFFNYNRATVSSAKQWDKNVRKWKKKHILHVTY